LPSPRIAQKTCQQKNEAANAPDIRKKHGIILAAIASRMSAMGIVSRG
jgi:hypothetical protein